MVFKFAKTSFDECTLPPAVVWGSILPMLDRDAVLCTKRYLSSLTHAEHWLQFRNVMVQLIVSEYEEPDILFPDIDNQQFTCDAIGWKDVPREILLSGWDDRGICMDDVLDGKRCSVFKRTPCTWFTGAAFNTIGNNKRAASTLA